MTKIVSLSDQELTAIQSSAQMLDYFAACFKEKTLPRAKAARDDMIGRQTELVDWLNAMQRLGDRLLQATTKQ